MRMCSPLIVEVPESTITQITPGLSADEAAEDIGAREPIRPAIQPLAMFDAMKVDNCYVEVRYCLPCSTDAACRQLNCTEVWN